MFALVRAENVSSSGMTSGGIPPASFDPTVSDFPVPVGHQSGSPRLDHKPAIPATQVAALNMSRAAEPRTRAGGDITFLTLKEANLQAAQRPQAPQPGTRVGGCACGQHASIPVSPTTRT